MTSSFSEEPNRGRPDLGQPEPGYTDKPLPRQPGATTAEERPPELPRLGSLAQTARLRQLNVARGILLFIGILTILVNGISMFAIRGAIEKEVDRELAKQGLSRIMADQVKLKELEDNAVVIPMLITGSAVLLGVLFVVFGLIVKRYPVPITITSLVLYVAATLLFGVLNPPSLAAGAVIKIVIIVALAKAIQSALAYEREAREQAALDPGY
jgi:hypothetical protein